MRGVFSCEISGINYMRGVFYRDKSGTILAIIEFLGDEKVHFLIFIKPILILVHAGCSYWKEDSKKSPHYPQIAGA